MAVVDLSEWILTFEKSKSSLLSLARKLNEALCYFLVSIIRFLIVPSKWFLCLSGCKSGKVNMRVTETLF